MENDKFRLGIVDDHQIVIDGLIALLSDQPGYEVTISSTFPSRVLQAMAHSSIDILLTDIMMPEMNGQELAKAVKKQFPSVKILALSMSGEGKLVDQLIREADIAGYILKNTGKSELLLALQKIAAGGTYFSEEVLTEIKNVPKPSLGSTNAPLPVRLTRREIEIVRLIEKEYSNKHIAEELYISERTVETHRKNIFRKTYTSSVIGLIKFAYENKLI